VEAVFFAGVFLLGCVGLAWLLAGLVLPQFRVNYQYVEHTCTVTDRRVGEIDAPAGRLYRPEIQIRYQIDGQTQSIWTYANPNPYVARRGEVQATVDTFQVGREYPCWYDPLDPSVAVLTRGAGGWSWLALAVPVSFLVIGGGSFAYRMVHFRASPERRSALARRAARVQIFEAPRPPSEDYPFIPDDATITDSPGTKLAYRLPISTPAWLLFWLAAGCLFWNGIVWALVVVVIARFRAGTPDWWSAASLMPFVLGGVGLIAYFVRRVWISNAVGPTLVEISQHPFRPGGRYSVLLSQSGQMFLRSFEFLLVCEEEATFRQGTHTRTERCCVWRRPLHSRRNFSVEPDAPYELQLDFEVPSRAMHSFRGHHNEIHWKLVVRGRAVGWPEFRREFPVVVYPPPGGVSS